MLSVLSYPKPQTAAVAGLPPDDVPPASPAPTVVPIGPDVPFPVMVPAPPIFNPPAALELPAPPIPAFAAALCLNTFLPFFDISFLL